MKLPFEPVRGAAQRAFHALRRLGARLAAGAAGVGALFLGGCHGGHAGPIERNLEQPPLKRLADDSLQVREDLVPLLKSAPAVRSDTTAELEGYGRFDFAPGASYAVRAPFDGIVESVEVEVGDVVETGRVLARIHSSDLAKLRADLVRLAASRAAEMDTVKRLETLVKDGASPRRDLIQAQARVQAIDAESEGVRNGLSAAHVEAEGGDRYLLRATRPGDVLARHVEPGEHVETNGDGPAFLVGDPTKLNIIANFPERDAPLLQAGAACRIMPSALGGEPLQGKVLSVVKTIEPGSRTTQAVCGLTSPDPRLRAQMTARVQVDVSSGPQLTVPRSAVLLRKDDRVVLVRTKPDVVVRRKVVAGMNIGSSIQILSGVELGEEVIVEGAVLLDGELDKLL